MPLKQSDATVSTFDGVFEKFRSESPKNKANLILFLADKDPSTSLSWCPGTFLNLHFPKKRKYFLPQLQLPIAEFLRNLLLLMPLLLWVFGILFVLWLFLLLANYVCEFLRGDLLPFVVRLGMSYHGEAWLPSFWTVFFLLFFSLLKNEIQMVASVKDNKGGSKKKNMCVYIWICL